MSDKVIGTKLSSGDPVAKEPTCEAEEETKQRERWTQGEKRGGGQDGEGRCRHFSVTSKGSLEVKAQRTTVLITLLGREREGTK